MCVDIVPNDPTLTVLDISLTIFDDHEFQLKLLFNALKKNNFGKTYYILRVRTFSSNTNPSS